MNLNWIGLIAALGTFFGIWFGHVAVRKIEYIAPNVWLPSIATWLGGLGLEAAAFATDNLQLSAMSGILGVTLLWDGLEFLRQQNRVKKGHAPANPINPRHARILAEYPTATTFDWLDRKPLGRKLSNEEITAIKEVNS